MTRRFKTKLSPGFPMLADKLKAEDYWRSQNRHDLIRKTDQIVTEFRAFHDEKETASSAWGKVWVTWYVRTVRIISAPKAPPEPRGRGGRTREAFRATKEDETTVPLSMVSEFAAGLRARLTRKGDDEPKETYTTPDIKEGY